MARHHLSVYDSGARDQISELADIIDSNTALYFWEKACATKWRKEPIWIHDDYPIGNRLIKDNKLSGVIDFGTTAMDDPACDLVIAWTYLCGKAHDFFVVDKLADHTTYFIGVRCDLAIIQEREYLCRDSELGLSNDQFDRVHTGTREYDLTVDTSNSPLYDIAKEIITFIENNPIPKALII